MTDITLYFYMGFIIALSVRLVFLNYLTLLGWLLMLLAWPVMLSLVGLYCIIKLLVSVKL